MADIGLVKPSSSPNWCLDLQLPANQALIITEMRTISHSGRLARGDLFKPMRSIHTTKA